MAVQAYVFVSTGSPGARRIVEHVRRLPGVIRADALFGPPDMIALIEGEDIRSMDIVVDSITALDGVIEVDTKVVRGI